ncbi:glutathione-disulfide reductase [Schlegelella sp. S2-27]|uniref:Glutathione-disulfide reductase n=1 Tax=Caldimonas mangrovi TaxID=2944811 RepID=A0ABT0YJL5_9BURK|nr:glutathione-disulfide reductase [Caldimonas mangrovi]MCM5678108.1 glutathione-disulfide reductase [Caldimonas mangrovi]
MPTSAAFDLVVIGGGSGGVRAARLAAQRGARVVLVEGQRLGGTCVNVGCIPKKLYSYASHYAQAFEEARGYGWQVDQPMFDWGRLRRQRAVEIERLNGVYERLLQDAGVQVRRGWAQLVDAHTVRIGTHDVYAERILVATGGAPRRPPFEGAELALSSDQLFDVEPFPRRLAIVGGGYIGCEFASIFHGLGAQVTLLQRGDRLLPGFDDEMARFVASELGKKGIALRFGASVQRVSRHAAGLEIHVGDGDPLQADAVLLATGRAPRTEGLGLEAAGVQMTDQGAIEVDAHFRTSVPSVFAIGDVVDHRALTPVALLQAGALVDRLYGCGNEAPREMRYDDVPTAVFCDPPAASVGLTEAQARERHGKLRIYRSEFRPLRHTLTGSDERAFMKLVVDDATDVVLGVHLVAPEAAEVIQGFAVALKAGATKALFDNTVAVHPTVAEELVLMRERHCSGGSSVA